MPADAERLARRAAPGQDPGRSGASGSAAAPGGETALGALLEIVDRAQCSAAGGGVFSVPDGSNARGAREVGCLPGSGPGFASVEDGRNLEAIKPDEIGGTGNRLASPLPIGHR